MYIITVNELGDTQYTRGAGAERVLNVMFEDMRMDRVTEIHLDPGSRKFFIEWRRPWAAPAANPVDAGEVHCYSHHSRIWLTVSPPDERGLPSIPKPCVPVEIYGGNKVFLFESYAEAIEYEVSCLDQLRRLGVTF